MIAGAQADNVQDSIDCAACQASDFTPAFIRATRFAFMIVVVTCLAMLTMMLRLYLHM